MFLKWSVPLVSPNDSGLFLQFCGFPEQLETFTSVVEESVFVAAGSDRWQRADG